MRSPSEPAPFLLRRGSAALLISMPHVGTHIPADLQARLSAAALGVPDTDWHLPLLYDFAEILDATVLVATHSRYVIDLNRPPDDANLYPGQDSTGLCPLDTFEHVRLYLEGAEPDAEEIAERRHTLWQPYHRTLEEELGRLRARHAQVLLWDAHSIRSQVPRFFAGVLPDLNVGTGGGRSCAPGVAHAVMQAAGQTPTFTAVLNGRFQGGYITRHYGNPAAGIQAVQLELAQRRYMDEQPPFAFDPARAAQLRPAVRAMIEAASSALTG